MATLKQIEANRRNSLKSTGPRTPEGKAVCSMNALRHGLRARTVVLPGEDREELNQLCDDLEVEWRPHTRKEQFHVEQMAVSQWKLTRVEASETDILHGTTAVAAQFPLLDRLSQCQCSLERSYARAQRELHRLQTSRPQVADPAEPAMIARAAAPQSLTWPARETVRSDHNPEPCHQARLPTPNAQSPTAAFPYNGVIPSSAPPGVPDRRPPPKNLTSCGLSD